MKIHSPDYRLSTQADIVISSRRDIRDICVSLIRMGWLTNESSQILEKAKQLATGTHRFWHSRTDLEVEYNEILNQSLTVVSRVASLLKVDITNDALKVISKYLTNLQSPKKFDRVTQLHENHRAAETTDFRLFFSKELKDNLGKVLSNWLTEFGY